MSKVKKRALSLLLAFTMIFTMAPGMPAFVAEAAEEINIAIDQTIMKLKAGEHATITGKASMSNASTSDASPSDAPWATSSDAEFTAVSDKEDVVTVESAKINKDGKFTVEITGADNLKAEDTAIITIGYEGLGTSDIDVTVAAAEITEPGEPVVTGVEVKTEELYLTPGSTGKIEAEIIASPANAEINPKIDWVCSKEGILEVTGEGTTATVTASKDITEETILSVRAKVGDILSNTKCVVTITPEPAVAVTGVELDQTDITLEKGWSTAIGATILPDNATNKNVSWDTSDKNIASIEIVQEGPNKGRCNITGVAAGTAVVTVTTEDGNKTATCRVTVEENKEPEKPVAVKSVKIVDLSGETVESTKLSEKAAMELKCIVNPENASVKDITWASSDNDVVEVEADLEFVYLTAKKASDKDVIISATVVPVEGEPVTAKCTVKVVADAIEVTGIELDREYLALEKGEEQPVTAIVLPTNATDKTVTWKSDNADVATVSEDGVVKAVKPGVAIITATTKNGKTASCRVWVKEFAFHLSRTSVTMKASKTESVSKEIKAVIDTEVTNMSVTEWTISKNDVATLKDATDKYVTVEFKPGIDKESKVTVTATINGKKAECVITILPADSEITGNDPAVKADALLDNLQNQDFDSMDETEKKEVLTQAVNTAKDILAATAKTADSNAAEAIGEVETTLVEVAGEFIEELNSNIEEVEGFETSGIKVTGALLNALDIALNNKVEGVVTPVLTVVPAADAAETEKKVNDMIKDSSNIKPMALDIELSFRDDNGTLDVTLGKDVIITMGVPDRFAGIEKLVMWHFHEAGKNPAGIQTKVNNNNMSFAVGSFSTFVLAEGTVSSGSNNRPSGGGGSGRSSSTGGSSSGNLAGNWIQDAAGWWFKTTTNGYPVNQWAKINNKWYHFNETGYMQTGWLNDNGTWYWLNADGSMSESTWTLVNGQWYYLHVGGRMLSSQWLLSNGQWYYLNADGSMAVSTTTPDGSTVDANGVWVQ